MERIPTLQEARNFVTRPNGDQVTVYQDGMTPDIQSEIYHVARISQGATVALAKILKGATHLESAERVWKFVRQIRYQLDPSGRQWIKTPARTIYDGFSDCKGYSILIHTLLTDLGIKNGFRFVAYGSGPVTHIFNFATIQGRELPIDACIDKFGTEAAYFRKEDYMPKIERLSGIGSVGIISGASLGAILGNLSENGIPEIMEISPLDSAHMAEVKGIAETTWHEANQVAAVQGIGSPLHNDLQDAVSDYIQAIQALESDDPISGIEAIQNNLTRRLPKWFNRFQTLKGKIKSGTATAKEVDFFNKLKARRQERGIRGLPDSVGTVGRIARRIGFFKKLKAGLKKAAKKVGSGLKKAANATGSGLKRAARATGQFAKKAGKGALNVVKKVAFAPIRLIIRTILPKAAPFFLYLFITNPETIKNLPPKVARKRRKAVSVSKFIVNVLAMKESLFMRIVRNGIMRKFKASPETVLARSIKGRINGIGNEGGGAAGGEKAPVDFGAYFKILMTLLDKIKSIFGKKPDEPVSEEDAPSPESDFEDQPVTTRRRVLTHLKNKPYGQRGEEPGTEEEETAQEYADNQAQEYAEQDEDAELEDPLPEAEPDENF